MLSIQTSFAPLDNLLVSSNDGEEIAPRRPRGHAVAAQEPLIIADARKDPIYRDNPSVRDLQIIAYAGVPLMVSGHALGAFCVIDSEPHPWSYDEVRVLRDLAECVIHEIDLRTQLREAQKRVRESDNVTH